MHISLQSEVCLCFRQMWKPDATAEFKKTPKQPLNKVSAVFKGLWMAVWNPQNPLYLFGINVQIFLSKSQYLKAITWKNFHQQKTWFCKSKGSGITKIDIIGFAYVNANLQLAL